MVLVVPPELPVKSLKELVDLAKAKPGTLNFSSAGLASSNYIAGELLKQTAKLDIVHIPYKGTPETLTSLMRNDAQISLAFLSTAQGMIQGGQAQASGVGGSKAERHPSRTSRPSPKPACRTTNMMHGSA